MKLATSFHNSIDAARAYQIYASEGRWIPVPIYITTRSVNYEFFPHFHPYVAANRARVPGMKLSLMERLKEGGLPELEDSDTLYMPQPNPPAGQPLQP